MPQSVQCPQCQAAVFVADDAGGSRVECPRCQSPFLVPGFGGGTGTSSSFDITTDPKKYPPTGEHPRTDADGGAGKNTDDDWLSDDWLGDNISLAPVKPRGGVPGSPGVPPEIAQESWAFDPADPVPGGLDPADPLDTNDATPKSDGLDGDALAAALDESDNAPRAPQYASVYNVRCPHCGTMTEVKAEKAGKEIRCRDCYNMIRVPPPPRVRKKVEMDMDAAPAFQFSADTASRPDRPADPFRKSASELLAAAEKQHVDEPEPDFDVPRIRDWAAAVFGIFLQIGVMAHWLILSSLASAVAFVALAIDSPILKFGLFPAGGFFGAIVLANGFAIMQSIANEEESVTEWPLTLEPSEWFGATLLSIAAAALACFPGWFLGYMTFGPSLTTVCLTMMSMFVIFPFVLLSMLDMQSVFVPFSPDIGRSITRCEEAWGGFYFSSAILFFVTFLIFAFASLIAPPAGAVVAVFTAVAAIFLYLAMLGRLAYAIGQSVNEAPRVNNIESEREAERVRNKAQDE